MPINRILLQDYSYIQNGKKTAPWFLMPRASRRLEAPAIMLGRRWNRSPPCGSWKYRIIHTVLSYLFIHDIHFYASMIFDNKNMCNGRWRWRKCLVYVYERVSVCHVGIKLSSTSSTEIGEHVREGVLSPRIIRSNTCIVEPR